MVRVKHAEFTLVNYWGVCYHYYVMKSATSMLLAKTNREIWCRGQAYANEGHVSIIRHDNQEVHALVKGTEDYHIILKFAPKGISQSCDCPYFQKNRYICKHVVAVAIIWDEKRGISCPNQALIEQKTVPPPAFSRRDINNLFKKPLIADLDQVRILADETALGGYVRPHSRLPKMPKWTSPKKMDT